VGRTITWRDPSSKLGEARYTVKGALLRITPIGRHEGAESRLGRHGAWTREGDPGGRERRYDDGSRGGDLGDAGKQAVPSGETDHAAAIAGGEARRDVLRFPRAEGGRKTRRDGDESLVGLCPSMYRHRHQQRKRLCSFRCAREREKTKPRGGEQRSSRSGVREKRSATKGAR
jgi:hypothetical protein